MTIEQISEKLSKADIKHTVNGSGSNARVVVTHIFGTRKNYGYLVAGDDGSTGTCQGITTRQGTVKAALRA